MNTHIGACPHEHAHTAWHLFLQTSLTPIQHTYVHTRIHVHRSSMPAQGAHVLNNNAPSSPSSRPHLPLPVHFTHKHTYACTRCTCTRQQRTFHAIFKASSRCSFFAKTCCVSSSSCFSTYFRSFSCSSREILASWVRTVETSPDALIIRPLLLVLSPPRVLTLA
jgi:hypothetical protein